MARIVPQALAAAIHAVRQMDLAQKQSLADDIHRRQPALLGYVLATSRLEVSTPKLDFLIEILLICDRAMHNTGLPWPSITEKDLLREQTLFVETVSHAPADERWKVLAGLVSEHPEKWLLAFVNNEVNRWALRVTPEESDRHVVITALVIANAIANARHEQIH